MAQGSRRRRPMSEINVVPYIDVMLVLLIIFMVTAPLLTQGVKVDLPQAAAEPVAANDPKTPPLVVSIDRALITEATVSGRTVRITVAFDADIAAVTRDAEGKLIAGSLTDATVTHDVWTFSRKIGRAHV